VASYYVWSGATGTGTGASWANAYVLLGTAFSGKVAGDIFYVAHDHAETTAAALTIGTAGTTAIPSKVICANRSGSVPPVSADRRTTGSVVTTGNSSITFSTGCTHYDGIIFIAGNSTGVANISPGGSSVWVRFDNCSLQIGSTGAGAINVGGAGGVQSNYVELNNTTISFSAVGQSIQIAGGLFRWRNTVAALIGAQVPTTVFTPGTGRGGLVECIGVDLSAAGSGKTIVGALAAANPIPYRFVDCKLDAAVTKSAVPLAHGSTEIDFTRYGASGVNYTVFRHRISGTLDHETTIVRTGGASDGTTPIAWKIITTANCTYSVPFECPPIAIWNITVGSAVTATIEGIWGGGAVPLDNDIWIEVEYLGSSATPQGSFVNDGTADLLATAANQTSSAVTWGGSTTKFKLNVTFTPQQAGWIYARVKCAKASSTFYIDPLVTLT
jgi:hypothetical protein